jgi:hypothetical protein
METPIRSHLRTVIFEWTQQRRRREAVETKVYNPLCSSDEQLDINASGKDDAGEED